MSENSELPSVTDAFVERIKTNERDAQYLIGTNNSGATNRSIFSKPDNNSHNRGVYEGLGSGDHVDEVYQKLLDADPALIDEDDLILEDTGGNQITLYNPNQAGSGIELVVGHGHMLTGENLAAYLTNGIITVNGQDKNAREYFDNLTKQQANALLDKDIKKHQRELNAHLESLGIDKNDMTKSQREALDEAMFQMGRTTFSEFNEFWTKVKQAVDETDAQTKKQKWAEAGLELLYGKNHDVPSGIWTQTPKRVRQYMEQLGVSKGRIDAAKDWKENEDWNSGSNFEGDIYVSDTPPANTLYTTEQVDETGTTSTETTETTEPSIQEAVATTETLEEISENKPERSNLSYWGIGQGYTPPSKLGFTPPKESLEAEEISENINPESLSYWGVGQGFTSPKKSLKESISDYADKATNKPEIEELTETYKIKKNDNLTKIAKKFKTNVKTLIDLNSEITEDNKNKIDIGQKIKVPTSSFDERLKDLIDSNKKIIKNYKEKKEKAKEKAIKKLKDEQASLSPSEISLAAKKQARENLETDIYSDPATPPKEDFFPSSVSPSAFDDFDEEAFTEDDYSDIDPDTYNEERKGKGKQGTYYEERRGGSQAAIDNYKARKGSYWGGGLQGYTPPKKPLNEFEQKLKEYGLMSTQQIKQSQKGVFESTLRKYGLEPKEGEIQEEDITATEAFGVGLADDLTLGLASWVYGRDDWDDLIKRAERQHKGALMAGRATGFVGSIFIPGGLAVKGAVTAARIGKGATKAAKLAEVAKAGAKVGAVEGAIGGFGYSRGETTLEVARDMGLGTLIGAGAGGSFGVVGAGGVGLWRKFKGKPGIFKEEPGSLELKQSIMGDEKRHIVFSRADSRAREERAFNVETLKSVVKFADLKSKDRKRLLNINGKNVDVKSLVIEWAQTVNPQNFLKRTKDEKLKIEQSTIKFAKKNKLQPELLHAYYNWRSELNNYMRYINDIGGRKERVGKDLKFSVNSLQKELTKFNKNIEAGLVNPTSYNEFKTQEYVAEAVRRFEKAKYAEANIGGKNAKDLDLYEAAAKEASEGLKRDPLSNFLLKKFSTVSNAAEVVDARAGSEMTRITYDLYVAEKLKTGFTRAVADKVKGALKIRESGKYAKMSDERIIKLIESGRKDPLADAYREVFKDIRQFANEKGVKVKEYRFGQEKYVPMKRKGAVDLIESSRDKWKEIQDTFSKEEINNILLKTDNKKFVTKNEELESDLKFLQSLVGDGINEQITSVNLLQKAINKFSDPQNVKSLLSPSIRNVHERHGTLPMWARETDLNSMALIDANSIGDLIYKRPVFNEMDTQIAFLKLRGFNNSANYFNNLKKDLLGIYRKGTEDKAADSIARELKIKTIPGGKLWLGLENAISTAIYPNYLGLNARAFVRNLTQPYTMTTRELGVGVEGDVLAVNATRKIIAEGFGNAQKRFNKLGLLDVRDPSAADFEGLKSGLRHSFKQNKIATKADRFIDGYADTAMYLYSKSDTINRLVTAQMAEDIAGAVVAGKTKWIKNAPKAIKIELQKNIDEGASKDEITQTIGKWLQVKTQLNYGKDDMYEFGREMGPMFAMLSKWPTAIASDIANKILIEGKKGAYKVGMKYLSPMVFAGGVQYLIDKEIDPKSAQSREMFGYGGLHSILPINSVAGLTDTFFPIPFDSALQTVGSGIELGAKGLSGRFDDQDSRKAEKVINRTLEQFTPVIGGVKRTIRHWENLTGETDKKRKRKEIKTRY